MERTWLCILRDGSSWWIGNEKAAREDLYWCDATLPGQEREEPALRTKKGWRVCACDDRTHKHFRGCEPTPELSWVDPRAPAPKPPAPATYDTEECPICLCAPGDEAARMPCGHARPPRPPMEGGGVGGATPIPALFVGRVRALPIAGQGHVS